LVDENLNDLVSDWSPTATERHDVVSAQRVRELAATLNLKYDGAEGGPLPPLWQWTYFLDWVPTCELGPDGHPRDGHLLPPLPNRRRMFAGGRLKFAAPLTVGDAARRRTTLVGKAVKRGRTGEQLFVSLRYDYLQGDEVRISEEQDLVYRSDASTPTPQSWVADPLGTPTTHWASVPQVDPILLFRVSALTGNAHRIHYDEAYTTGVEGFPALVVHGPLLALYMAELVRANGYQIRTFNFRLTRPVFIGDSIRVEGTPSEGRASAQLAVVSGAGTVHATASATFG
jgi:3-methylfumaryl-CoA hydratase